MQLTPFEKLKAHREKMAFESSATKALMDLIEREQECQAQIDYYKTLTGIEREEEGVIMMEVMKDQRALNEAIALICKNLSLDA